MNLQAFDVRGKGVIGVSSSFTKPSFVYRPSLLHVGYCDEASFGGRGGYRSGFIGKFLEFLKKHGFVSRVVGTIPNPIARGDKTISIFEW